MKTIIAVLSFLIIGSSAIAQNGLINGRVLSDKQEPLAGASVTLIHLPDSILISGQAADITGSYHFTQIKAGKYVVKAALVAYLTVFSKPIEFTGDKTDIPAIVLIRSTKMLKEVVISTSVPRLEQKSDRLVVNVERLNTTGDNALDVIKKAPGIKLDKDDNILYRNNIGVTILIDGRRTYMNGAELTNYLKSMPGKAVSKIELSANPPGNYDAEGTAGVINIILKRNKAEGYNGSVNTNAGYGKYGKVFGGTDLNYNTGKLSFFTRANTGYFDSYNKLTLNRLIEGDQYNQLNYWHPKSVQTGYTIGTDYRADNRQTFGIMLKGYNDPTNAEVTSRSITNNAQGQNEGSIIGVDPQKTNVNTYSANLNYSLLMDTTGQKLSIDADYVYSSSSGSDNYTNSYFDKYGNISGSPIQLRNNNPVSYNIKALKADYILPLNKQWQVETGLKSSWVHTHANVVFDSLKTAGWITDPKRSNNFVYTENINAAYITLSKKFNAQWDIKASLRTEQTNSEANSLSRNEIVKRNYWQLFPSAFITYKIDADNQFNASYSRRISRPNYGSLNSAIRYTDAYTAIQGNPYLLPSVSESYVFNYSYKSFQILSLSYLKVSQAVTDIINQNDQTKESISTYGNLGNTSTISATSAGSFNIVKWWNVNMELDGAYDEVNTEVQGHAYNSSGFSWSGNIDQTFILAKEMKLQLSAQYFSPSISGLSHMLSVTQIDAGITRTFLDKRLTLSFKARDIFFGNRYRSILRYNNVDTRWTNEYESRRFTLGVNYQFGNSKLQAARSRQTGSHAEEIRM